MRKSMTLKGFAVILALILAVFLCLHLMLKGDLSRKAEHLESLSTLGKKLMTYAWQLQRP